MKFYPNLFVVMGLLLSLFINTYGISYGQVPPQRPFISTWTTNNPGISGYNQITIPTFPGENYNYTVDWGDGTITSGHTGDVTHTYSVPGSYQIRITGDFPRIYFKELINDIFTQKDTEKIQSIDQWGDIEWHSMDSAFSGCRNLDVKSTDIPNLNSVQSLERMFQSCSSLIGTAAFNNWDVSNVKKTSWMFFGATSFNKNISNWDISNVYDISGMFNSAESFNQDISKWDVSQVTDMSGLFYSARAFNQDISQWNVSNVIDMGGMFSTATSFNQPIGIWDVSNVKNMSNMFSQATIFNQDISNWDVSNVTNMHSMFGGAKSFNMPIGNWNVSNVKIMASMFSSASKFNQNLANWDVSSVEQMYFMFAFTEAFDQDISTWDVSNVTYMDYMFAFAKSFNQPIGTWQVDQVIYMDYMFDNALSFNRSLGNWNIGNVHQLDDMFRNSGLSTENYDQTLTGWSKLRSLQNGITFDAGTSQYCMSEDARQVIIDNYGWTINDSGKTQHCSDDKAFTSTWKTDNPGASKDNQIKIPVNINYTYDFEIDWGDGNMNHGVNGAITHTYAQPGTYSIKITGQFPSIAFVNSGDKDKILSIDQWGAIKWNSMEGAFEGCSNLDVLANDSPDFTEVTSLNSMFKDCISLEGNEFFNGWNLSTITSIKSMFSGAIKFNQSLENWDVSNVIDMSGTFGWATHFNQPLDKWNVTNVKAMFAMFFAAESFNQDLSSWNVSNVRSMDSMFDSASSFDQNLGSWNPQNLTNATLMFNRAGLSRENYDSLLIGWNGNQLRKNVKFDAGYSQYCAGENARQNLINSYGWNITDSGSKKIEIDEIALQTVDGGYLLPTITGTNLSGNEKYYTGPKGTGEVFEAGAKVLFSDFEKSPVILYIYDSEGEGKSVCSGELSFELAFESSCNNFKADVLSQQVSCTKFLLPELSTGNKYYTGPNATGTELKANDWIYTSREIFIYKESGNCYDESIFTITINPSLCKTPIDFCTLTFSTFITPNGDSKNDSFKVLQNSCEKTGKLSIVDRFGRLIYQTRNIYEGWDGFHSSKYLPEADYWYQFIDDETGKVYTGHFTLLR